MNVFAPPALAHGDRTLGFTCYCWGLGAAAAWDELMAAFSMLFGEDNVR